MDTETFASDLAGQSGLGVTAFDLLAKIFVVSKLITPH